MESAEPGTPQSWNRYLYSRGRPLKFTDPDGKAVKIPSQQEYEHNAAVRHAAVAVATALNGEAAGNAVDLILSAHLPVNDDEFRRMVQATADDAVLAILPVPVGTVIQPAAGGVSRSRLIIQKVFEFRLTKGNFSLGSLSRQEAIEVGRAFVGEGAIEITKNGRAIGMRSADGLKVFRFPAQKVRGQAAGRTQANLEEFFIDEAGRKIQIRNGHINVQE